MLRLVVAGSVSRRPCP